MSVRLHAGSSGSKSTAASLLSVLLSRISTRQPLLGGSSGGDVSFLLSKLDKLTAAPAAAAFLAGIYNFC